MRTMALPSSHGLAQRGGLVLAIAVAIQLVVYSDDSNGDVLQLLQHHTPSLRIFRALLELNLVLWLAATAVAMWGRVIPATILAQLLFQPVLLNDSNITLVGEGTLPYAAVQDEEDEDMAADDGSDADANDEIQKEPHLPDSIAADITCSNTVPTWQSLLVAAMDMLVVILVFMFLFCLDASGSLSVYGPDDWATHWSWIVAPLFALLLFVVMMYQALFPLAQRLPVWTVLARTVGAPYHAVTFRDGFVGDVLTSSVRPLQDIAFTLFYLVCGLRGWWTESNVAASSLVDLADAQVPALERSWLLHTAVLPMCVLSPLWWRFLQTMRQCYNENTRWPYLGNAAKYFGAAVSAMVGVFYPECTSSLGFWLLASASTCYQIWWDIVMDWSLLERGSWRIRKQRLYGGVRQSTTLYWTIATINVVLRFGWTLTFVPRNYLDATTGALHRTFAGGNSVTGALNGTLASAELVRRALWGLLRVEWEAIKHMPNKNVNERSSSSSSSNSVEMMAAGELRRDGDNDKQAFENLPEAAASDETAGARARLLGELTAYSAVFCITGFVIAAHRGTA